MVPDAPSNNPFASVVLKPESPFAAVADATNGSRPLEPGKPAKLPDKRKASDSPFQLADSKESFGFDAPAPGYAPSPFEAAPAPAPFGIPVASPAASPFGIAVPAQPAPAPSHAPAPSPFSVEAPVAAQHQPVAQPPAWPQPAPQAAPAAPALNLESDSSSIRQLELRAIFGVDRELSADEILQRSRSLPGIRAIVRLKGQDIGALEGVKQLVSNLGLGAGAVRLYAGNAPIEFIREGASVLAVQNDGSFAPGVRETLMIVARELGRLS